MRAHIRIFVATALLVCWVTGAAAEPMRRFVLAAGANNGGGDRVMLRYAATDAEEFSQVMLQMGGVAPENNLLLKDPDLADFVQAVKQVNGMVRKARGEAARTEVWIYYSGHADEEGLLLGGERLGYRELRKMMDGLEADVRVAVLDACASGAITRIKGGQRRKAFLVDASSDTRGYAFLTSSSAEETAQESDRIQASFFTHYLVSGMRGAADVSGDGLSRATRYFPLVGIIVGALAAAMFWGAQLLFPVGIAVGPRSNSAWLYVVATAPPRTGVDTDVRSQPKWISQL